MEDNLVTFVNGRQLLLLEMGDDLNIFLNGSQPNVQLVHLFLAVTAAQEVHPSLRSSVHSSVRSSH
jgi:hypothetical protein